MAAAVERIVVGLRDGCGGVHRVVGVSCQVDAARDLDRIGVDRGLPGVLRSECCLIRRDRAGAAEIGMGVVNAGVHDADGDARARARRSGPRGRCADERYGDEVVALLWHQAMHCLDPGDPREAIEIIGISAHGHAGVDVGGLEDDVLLAYGSAYSRRERVDARDRRAGGHLLGPRRGCGGPGHGSGHGIELEHDAHGLRRCGQRKSLQRAGALRGSRMRGHRQGCEEQTRQGCECS